ncbi:DUF4259 domain-containing protein [Lysobacter antibioticus]|uniref:DUF4259 domain-containing protein n=1 Tax=Lysobacter antibioticus TaxID=84531 RepID=UPI001C9446E8
MGTWSHEPFGNDTANDWAYGLEESQDFSLVDEALQRVIDTGDEYLDADVAAEAVAAAEVIAKALGRGTQSDVYTEKVDSWLASSAPELEPGLATKAQSALLRVLGQDSELRELWEEGGVRSLGTLNQFIAIGHYRLRCVPLFEPYRGRALVGTMPPLGVVEQLDVVEHTRCRGSLRRVRGSGVAAAGVAYRRPHCGGDTPPSSV